MTDISVAEAPPSPEARPLEPAFPAWGLLWRLAVSTGGVMSVIGAPWAGVWFYRWFAGRIALPGGRPLRLEAEAASSGLLFAAIGLSNWFEDGLGDLMGAEAVLMVSVLVEAALWAWLIKWLIPRLSADGAATRLGFTGSFVGLAAWTILFYVGIVSLIGWAWALKNMLRWIAARIDGPIAVEFRASGAGILWRTALSVLACIPVVTIPWALGRWTNWLLSQFVVSEKVVSEKACPTSAAAPG